MSAAQPVFPDQLPLPPPEPSKQEEPDPFPFSLEIAGVFDGPLDVLLALVRKQNLDIFDLPIAKITAQFLEFVKRLEIDDIDLAAEFTYMAAQLCQIKSKLLLPQEAKKMGTPEDPRLDLVNRLIEHEKFKQAAGMLREKQFVEQSSWTNPGMREFLGTVPEEELVPVNRETGGYDLLRKLKEVKDRAASQPAYVIDEDAVSVSEMATYLRRRLAIEDHPISLAAALGEHASARILAAALLALLEMVRLGAVVLRQQDLFSSIWIKKTSQFDAAFENSLSSDRWD